MGYESTYRRLKSCARRAHELEARQEALQQEAAQLQRELERLGTRYQKICAARRRTNTALCRRRADLAQLERFLESLPDARSRQLLRLHYLEGRTVPQVRQALAAQGEYLGQRHLERLLTRAERAAAREWPAWAEQEEANGANSHA